MIKFQERGSRLAWLVARDPCAEALQRTRVRLLARVPLLRVTLSLTLFAVTLFSCPVNKARKGQKKIPGEKQKYIYSVSQDY